MRNYGFNGDIKITTPGKGKFFPGWYLHPVFEQFLNHIRRHQLFRDKERILLAVSGGMDSVTMVDLFRRGGFNVGIAHAHFGLRGPASDADAAFVRDLAFRYAIPYFEQKFKRQEVIEAEGMSTQMAARDLRYRWFRELMATEGFALTATAHHLNDSLETLLLNLTRGTGMDGLTGISMRHQRIIRPLLFATRDQIETYAMENDLRWREDESNASDDYQRNLIRHRVIPVLREINPNLMNTFALTVSRLAAGREFARQFLKSFSIKNIAYDGKHVFIRKEGIMRSPYGAEILWELLKDLGFGYEQCQSIALREHQSGAVFFSASHQLTVDRDHFMVGTVESKPGIIVEVPERATKMVAGGLSLSFEHVAADGFAVDPDADIAQLDVEKLIFPLVWRDWAAGDRFVPLGMKEAKKVSDFLIDAKVARARKARVTVLTSAGEIVWLVGFRIADPFKVTPATRRVLIARVGEETPSGQKDAE